MRIRLHEKFDWRVPGKRSWQSFPVGDHTMKREAGEEAIRLGKGKEIEKPAKGEPVNHAAGLKSNPNDPLGQIAIRANRPLP